MPTNQEWGFTSLIFPISKKTNDFLSKSKVIKISGAQDDKDWSIISMGLDIFRQ